ncbi:hypothetical protein LOTGIDRAFT_156963 [Lottia gigantea]|uniref:Uncharacterized protein n=1 Tax=Lottia gigantea TaxID=225164 RepID=V4CL60_LOTGI|nr:hypothetical protein LOTGIDRAFT_156963 [Lottia gigantea]ESP03005.1 hypothetical protein LOTGIDRAFT_156963 [Lottia gigantea]
MGSILQDDTVSQSEDSDNFSSIDVSDFDENTFLTCQDASKSKRIIPVVMHPCNNIPRILKDLTTVDLTGTDSLLLEWQWKKLTSSIKDPITIRDSFDSLPYETRV